MGRKPKIQEKSIKDPQDYPISKKKTLLTNLNSYIRMLHNNFPDMPAKQYIKNVHRFVDKIKRKLKFTEQEKLISARQKIKICTDCDRWSGNRSMIKCNLCQDYHHLTCLKNKPSEQQKQDWYCQHCQDIVNKAQSDTNEHLISHCQQDSCSKCQKQKKSHQAFVMCIKCNSKYHKNCYGKSNVVCYKCDQTIEKQIKQKQASLFDYNFFSTSKKNKKQNSTKKQSLKNFGKQYIDESTRASFGSMNESPKFTKNYPQMTRQEIEQYRNGLLYAIRAKGMKHVQKLMPIQCEIQNDNQQSLDFGLMHMSRQEFQVYKKYKAQPFGPFKFVYKQNMGYDVIADKDLPQNMLVCQYVGDVVTWREIIFQQNTKGHNDSLFQLQAGRNANQTLYIRPQKYTNMARFINGVNNKTGKSKQNLASIRLLANGIPGIFLYTTRKIKRGQSLAYDYNAGCLNAYNTDDFV